MSMKFRKLYITIIVALFLWTWLLNQSIKEKIGREIWVVIQLERGEKSGRITEMEGTYYYTSKE